MFNEGETALPYESFTGGIPSPNPDYPQRIQCVDVKEVVSSIGGRNLARGTSSEYVTANNITGGNNNLSQTIATVYNEGLSVGDSISIRALLKHSDIVAMEGNSARCRIQGQGDVTGWSDGTFFLLWEHLSGTGEIECVYKTSLTETHLTNKYWTVNIRCDYIESGTLEWKEFSVKKDGTPWTPAPEDITDSNRKKYLPYISKATMPITLRSIGNVRDKLSCRNGVWGINRHLQQATYNTAAVSEFNPMPNSKELRIVNPGKKSTPTCSLLMSDKFIKYSNTTWDVDRMGIFNTASTNNNELAFRVPVDADKKTYFMDNPVTFIYELAEPVWEPLPDDLQAQLNNLLIYSGNTACVYLTGSEIAPEMAVEYVMDTNKVIQELRTAIIALGGMK